MSGSIGPTGDEMMEPTPTPRTNKLRPDQAAGLLGSLRAMEERDEADRFGEYTLLARLGAGAGGVVYRAIRPGSSREVALKILHIRTSDDAATRRVWRELELLESLHLSCVPRVLDYGMERGQMFITTELVRGRSLEQRGTELRPNLRSVAEVMARVADAVQVLHEHGIIHRDLKPTNIMVEDSGEVLIVDLGLAMLADRGGHTLTEEGTPIGTPGFMAPEQARGERERFTTRTDVYGLGATAFWLLTGETPHDLNCSLHEAVRRVAQDPPRDPRMLNPSLSRGLSEVLRMACEGTPSRRYGSAFELGNDFRRWLRGERVLAMPPGAFTRTVSWCRSHWALCAAVALTLSVVVMWAWHVRANAPRLAARFVPSLSEGCCLTGVTVAGDRVIVVGSQQSPAGADGLLLEFDPAGERPVSVARWPGVTEENGLEAVAELQELSGSARSIVICGENRTLVTDTRGGKEAKGIVARVGLPFSTTTDMVQAQRVLWHRQIPDAPGAFEYGGMEVLNSLAVAQEPDGVCCYAVGWGAISAGQFRMFVTKLDADGNILWTWTDRADAQSSATGVIVLGGSAYVVGWERSNESNRPVLRRFDSQGAQTRFERNDGASGCYLGVCRSGDVIVAVGRLGDSAATATPSHERRVASDGILADCWSSDGQIKWTRAQRQSTHDQLRAVASVGRRIFAVGSTDSGTRGGRDCLLVEIDPDDGHIASTAPYGGKGEDESVALSASGPDLYVGAMTRSFPPPTGQLGERYPMLLHYVIPPRP